MPADVPILSLSIPSRDLDAPSVAPGPGGCPGRSGSREEGFALALVVLLLFAVAMTGAVGYQVARTEFFQSQQAAETGQALSVAQAGLDWFVGGHLGVMPDSTSYSMNGGTAVIRTRKVGTISREEDLYLVTSEGIYADPRFPQIPATRSVSQYTIYHKVPMNTLAPVVTTAPGVSIESWARVDGTDQAPPGQCTGATGSTLAGVVARDSVRIRNGGSLVGSPQGLTPGSFDAVVDSVGLRWDVLSDPNFPVEFDDSWPNFWSLPPDSFPVVRVNGDFAPGWSRWGRGVLIVTGELRIPSFHFWFWDGLVLAGDVQSMGEWDFFLLRGALVSGQGTAMDHWTMERGYILYDACKVEKAGMSLAHLTPVENSWWEER